MIEITEYYSLYREQWKLDLLAIILWQYAILFLTSHMLLWLCNVINTSHFNLVLFGMVLVFAHGFILVVESHLSHTDCQIKP
jgi:hypothetical protein